MKHLYLLPFFLCFSIALFAQNVGIGTPTPTALLDIDGNLRVRTVPAGNYATDMVLTSDPNGNVGQLSFSDASPTSKYVSNYFPAIYVTEDTLGGTQSITLPADGTYLFLYTFLATTDEGPQALAGNLMVTLAQNTTILENLMPVLDMDLPHTTGTNYDQTITRHNLVTGATGDLVSISFQDSNSASLEGYRVSRIRMTAIRIAN